MELHGNTTSATSWVDSTEFEYKGVQYIHDKYYDECGETDVIWKDEFGSETEIDFEYGDQEVLESMIEKQWS